MSRIPWIKEILTHIEEVMTKKNADYATDDDWLSNFRKYGLFGMMARLNDKVQRAENILFRFHRAEVSSETVMDTLEDLASYALLVRQAIKEDLPTFGVFQEKSSAQAFIIHLERASKEVAKWPKWKRDSLGIKTQKKGK